jgi:hypothetical protein
MLLLSGCATWRKEDTYREAAALALIAVDHGQTLNIAKHPEKWTETNPILGEHPSIAEVNRYFVAAYILHPTISAVLPPKYRTWWQWVTIGVQAGYVTHNFSIGINMDF